MSSLFPPLCVLGGGAGELLLLRALRAGGHDLGEYVRLAQDQNVVGTELDLGPAVLREDDLVALRHVERAELARVLVAGGGGGEPREAPGHGVAGARLLPLEDASRLLSYKGEGEIAEKAIERLV